MLTMFQSCRLRIIFRRFRLERMSHGYSYLGGKAALVQSGLTRPRQRHAQATARAMHDQQARLRLRYICAIEGQRAMRLAFSVRNGRETQRDPPSGALAQLHQ
jgi:hypothetical protein